MSTEVKSKEKVNMDPKYIIKLTVTLFVTCVVVAGALGLVNSVTEGPIADINKANTEAAMKQVVADPDNSEFSEALELTEEMTGGHRRRRHPHRGLCRHRERRERRLRPQDRGLRLSGQHRDDGRRGRRRHRHRRVHRR